ncbi:MAG: hypothetical protein NT105_17650 [Verrucomicrobia bacterium]|nr:hypothetical protein [Verrucomicrobiota bacterium]
MKARRISPVIALAFLIATSTLTLPSAHAAGFSFGPGELILDPADWQNVNSDPDWSIKLPFIIRRSNSQESTFQFRHPIPKFFEIAFDFMLDSTGGSDGKGIKIRTANAHFSVAVDDDYPLGLYDIPARKYRATDVRLNVRDHHTYHFSARASPETLSATVDGKTVSTRWTATPPFNLSFFAQRSGFRVKSIKITEIKK